MASSEPQSLSLRIKPQFDHNGEAHSLGFSLALECPSLTAGQSLCCLNTKMGNGTTQCYTKDQIHVSDSDGFLDIEIHDKGRMRSYLVNRPTTGNVVMNFVAHPVKVDSKTPIGGRYELRRDQGGLQCMGLSTIPIPWDVSLTTKARYRMEIEWDLSDAPQGTRAVSSFGEGRVQRVHPPFDLWRMVFTVGPLKSYPLDAPRGGHFGFYWFGKPPTSITALPPVCEELFAKMSNFFRDKASEENPYRIFVRRATPARGFGGSGGIRSFVLEYDDAIDTISQDEIFTLLAHEMVHNWPLMAADSKEDDLDLVAWYNEGVADYYAAVLPYRISHRTKACFRKHLNAKFTEYYTNPCRLVSNRQAEDKAWTSPNLQTVPYTRGLMYFCKLDAQIRRASNGCKSVDELVLSLLEKLRKYEPFGIREWKDMLVDVLGAKALEDFQTMNKGELIRLPADAFAPDYEVVRVDERELDFGFDMGSFSKRVVSGLNLTSEAAKAGLEDGDEIIKNTFVWQCQQNYERKMRMTIRRGHVEHKIEYWPRAEKMVESWRLHETKS